MKVLGTIKDLWNRFMAQSLLKKLIIGSAVAGVIVMTILLMRFFYAKPKAVTAKPVTPAMSEVSDLEIIIPSGAFSEDKKFHIKKISIGSDEYNDITSKWQFDGPIYDVIPADGRDEWALEPIDIGYRLPSSLTDIKDVDNVIVKYISDKNPNVERQFYGAEVRIKDNIPYIQVISHHLSKIGIEITPVKNVTYGLNHVIDKPETLKPHILLIGGIDDNFYSLIPRTVTDKNPQGKNLWEIFFPDRNIWVYRYPLKDTRSLIYTSEFDYYFRNEALKSYIIFEGEKLKQALANTNRDFDIIAQGIGGLIARYALESNDVVKNVKHIVLMDCPNYGSNLVDMTTFKPFYDMPPKTLAETYNINTPEIFSILRNTVISYVEKLNTYADEIFPNSNVMKLLNSFKKRKDVKYMAIAGDVPSFSTNIATNTRFASLYPEIIKGEGDGLVSVNSALLKYADVKKIYHHSFSDMYLGNDVIRDIRAFLNDEFPIKKVKKKIPSEGGKKKRSIVATPVSPSKPSWKYERIHRDNSSLKRLSSVNVSKDTIGINVEEGTLWSYTPHSVDMGEREIFRDNDINLISMDVYGKRAVFLDGLKKHIYNLNNGRISRYVLPVHDKNLVDVCEAGEITYILLGDTKGSYVYRLNRSGGLKEVIEMNGTARGIKYITSYNQILAYTNTDIALLDHNGSLITYKLITSIVKATGKARPPEEISDVTRKGPFLYVLTRGYSIYSFNMINGDATLITSGDVGNKKLLPMGKYVIVVGEKTFNFLDVQDDVRIGKYYELGNNEKIIDATAYGSHIYALIEERSGNEKIVTFSMGL